MKNPFVGLFRPRDKPRNAIFTDEVIRYGSTKYTSKRPDYDKLT